LQPSVTRRWPSEQRQSWVSSKTTVASPPAGCPPSAAGNFGWCLSLNFWTSLATAVQLSRPAFILLREPKHPLLTFFIGNFVSEGARLFDTPAPVFWIIGCADHVGGAHLTSGASGHLLSLLVLRDGRNPLPSETMVPCPPQNRYGRLESAALAPACGSTRDRQGAMEAPQADLS
jgi:hypothetical protein